MDIQVEIDGGLSTQQELATQRRGFWALVATQFQGAYSDNILRNLLLAIVVGMGLGQDRRDSFVSIVTFIFSVPFLLLSMPGGWAGRSLQQAPNHHLDQVDGVGIHDPGDGRPGAA